MALIKCTECGKEFSDKALLCPNCGCPIEYVLEELEKFTYGSTTLRVECISNITGLGIVVTGVINGGPLKVGDNLSWQCRGQIYSASIRMLTSNRKKVPVANAGEIVDILLAGEGRIETGCVLSL